MHHAQAWRSQGFVVVFIVCLDDLANFSDQSWIGQVDALLVRANRGYDFGAWATAIHELPNLDQATRLVTVNDSVYGPFDTFAGFVQRLRDAGSDIVGAVESHEHRHHYQSFLLSFGPRALAHDAFRNFWLGMYVGGRREVIAMYELRLLEKMLAAGLTAEALLCQRLSEAGNPTLGNWRALIDAGFPYIKVQLLRDNPLASDLAGWRDIMRRHSYDPEMVDAHLGRSVPAS